MRNILRLSAVLAAGTMLAAGSAWADDHTGDMDVSATVTEVCVIDEVNPMSFENVNFLTTDHFQTTTVSIICTNGASYDIGLDDGGHVNGGVRRMQHETDAVFLSYNLGTSENGTEIGTGDPDKNLADGVTADGTSESYTVHGTIPTVDSLLPAGDYTDTVEVKVRLTPAG